ncbi:MAG: isoaspartyl peptidase/L-asparaginase [Bacteroidota bacterium]
MRTLLLSFFLFSILTACDTSDTMTTESDTTTANTTTPEKAEYAIVIHGGAGTILKKNMTPETEKAYLDKMNEALDAGEKILKKGGTSMDAVIATIKLMEDSPLFNAGKGAVFTNEGVNELDASIMEGKTLNAGAVGGVRTVRNPITAARAVLENSEHVMMVGAGADQFAKTQNLDLVDNSYFHTDRRKKSLEKVLEREANQQEATQDEKHGTVGCVALDKNGNIVAGTSTGGMTNKRYNRIGDSPIIGAGTYANNNTCGVSSTGHGEFFIRYVVAYDIAAMMEYSNMSLQEAANKVVNEKLVEAGGSGGIVALDAYGNIAMPFNSEGMYRGYAKPGERVVKIYKE